MEIESKPDEAAAEDACVHVSIPSCRWWPRRLQWPGRESNPQNHHTVKVAALPKFAYLAVFYLVSWPKDSSSLMQVSKVTIRPCWTPIAVFTSMFFATSGLSRNLWRSEERRVGK